MTLRALQRAFRDEISAGDDATAPSSPGMAIYRSAYRGRLLAALAGSFPRTRRWVGEDAFDAAACHHILTTPPRSWSIDHHGEGFPSLLAELFAEDPEVAELAWHEWLMQCAFSAPDDDTLDPDTLARAGLAPQEWDRIVFRMAAGYAARVTQHDCAADPARLQGPHGLLVWRQDVRSRARLADMAELGALQDIAAGRSLGETFGGRHDVSPEQLAAWLARWLQDGLFAGFSLKTE